MKHDEGEGVCLEFGCSGCAGEERVEDRMDKDGAEVFEDEDCSPCYLRPYIWGFCSQRERDGKREGRDIRAAYLYL